MDYFQKNYKQMDKETVIFNMYVRRWTNKRMEMLSNYKQIHSLEIPLYVTVDFLSQTVNSARQVADLRVDVW